MDFLNVLNNDAVLEVFEGLPQFTISKTDLSEGISITDLLAEKTSVFPSKGEARKMIIGGGVSVNKQKVDDPAYTYSASDLINNRFLVAQKGKKNYFLIISE